MLPELAIHLWNGPANGRHPAVFGHNVPEGWSLLAAGEVTRHAGGNKIRDDRAVDDASWQTEVVDLPADLEWEVEEARERRSRY